VTQSDTPYSKTQLIRHGGKRREGKGFLTGSRSSIRLIIRSAQSPIGITVGCFRYSLSKVNAAFFLTKVLEVLRSRVISRLFLV
jgi:hypothetical protein